MKKYFRAAAVCSGLALASCEEGTSLNEDQPVDIVALLNSGDPTVCAVPEVQELALNIAEPEYEKFKAEGGEPISFQAISATDVNKDINEVTCSANLMAYAGDLLQGVEIRSAPINYKIRPALDVNGTYLVEIVPAEPVKDAIQAHIFLSKLVKKDEENVAQESAEPPELSTDNIVANDTTPIDEEVSNQIDDAHAIEDADNSIY